MKERGFESVERQATRESGEVDVRSSGAGTVGDEEERRLFRRRTALEKDNFALVNSGWRDVGLWHLPEHVGLWGLLS
jgi:hypothetical protein